jgi:membrane protein required for colicin V production
MNIFDIIVIVILAYCIIRGIFRGLLKELSSIIGVFGGFYAAYTYYAVVAKPLSRWISHTGYLNLVSFIIIFCIVFLVISILGVIINYLLKLAFLGWFDRSAGALFGAVKGILIVSVLLIALTAFLPKGSPFIKDSLLSPHIAYISEKLVKVDSKNIKHAFTAKIEELRKIWKK